jgi:hypothetical protein
LLFRVATPIFEEFVHRANKLSIFTLRIFPEGGKQQKYLVKQKERE